MQISEEVFLDKIVWDKLLKSGTVEQSLGQYLRQTNTVRCRLNSKTRRDRD